MSLYRRKGSPYWQYSFAIDGVRFRGSTGCAGKKEAAAVEAEERYDAKQRRKRVDPWRIRDCLGAYWFEHGQHKPSAANIKVKLSALSRILGPDTMILDIVNTDLLDYRAARVGEGLRPHGVNRDFTYLKAAFRHANEMHGKQIPALAWSRIRMTEPKHRTRYLTQEEYGRLLEHCPPNVGLIVQFAVATGLRKGNILQLDWSEVDLDGGMIAVTLKGDKRHTINMSPAVRAALSTVTGERRGKVFQTAGFRKQYEKAVIAAELEDFRFHDLRHTAATWMRMAGADLADIKEALGHSSVAVTMRYAHIEAQHHITAFDRISERVWSQNPSQSSFEKKKG